MLRSASVVRVRGSIARLGDDSHCLVLHALTMLARHININNKQ